MYWYTRPTKKEVKGIGGLIYKVSASQPLGRGFEPHTCHDHDSSYDTRTGWFQETDSREIYISCFTK